MVQTRSRLSRSMEERLQSMIMKLDQMASILQELQSVKKDMTELRELLRKDKIQLEDSQEVSADQEHGGVPLPSIPKQPTIIQEVSEVQERAGSCWDSTHECIEVQEASVCPEPTESCSDSVLSRNSAKIASGNGGSSTFISLDLFREAASRYEFVAAMCNSKQSVQASDHRLQCVGEIFETAKTSRIQGLNTWLYASHLEKSKPQLFSTFSTFQLSCNFSLWQKNVDGLQLDSISSVSGVSDQNMGFNFQENGPSSLQQWVNSVKPVYVSIHWSFHVKLSCTRTLLQIWFKGKLIVMLYGRFCSLRGKDKKMPKG